MSGSSIKGVRLMLSNTPYSGRIPFTLGFISDDPKEDKSMSPGKYWEQGFTGGRILGAYKNWTLGYEYTKVEGEAENRQGKDFNVDRQEHAIIVGYGVMRKIDRYSHFYVQGNLKFGATKLQFASRENDQETHEKWAFTMGPELDVGVFFGQETGFKCGIHNPIALRLPFPGEETSYSCLSLVNPSVAIIYNF